MQTLMMDGVKKCHNISKYNVRTKREFCPIYYLSHLLCRLIGCQITSRFTLSDTWITAVIVNQQLVVQSVKVVALLTCFGNKERMMTSRTEN